MWAVDKSTALAGGPLTVTVFDQGFDAVTFNGGSIGGFALQPARTFSAAEPKLYIVDKGSVTSGGTPLLRLSEIAGGVGECFAATLSNCKRAGPHSQRCEP